VRSHRVVGRPAGNTDTRRQSHSTPIIEHVLLLQPCSGDLTQQCISVAQQHHNVPAGKDMPMGKRVCESPPVPSVSGKSILFSQLWMMPSPGRRDTPPRLRMKSGREWWVTTSTGCISTIAMGLST
jgi:hypothetical protein